MMPRISSRKRGSSPQSFNGQRKKMVLNEALERPNKESFIWVCGETDLRTLTIADKIPWIGLPLHIHIEFNIV